MTRVNSDGESKMATVNVVGVLSPDKLAALREVLDLDGAWGIVLLPYCTISDDNAGVINSVVEIRFSDPVLSEVQLPAADQSVAGDLQSLSETLQGFREKVLMGLHAKGTVFPGQCPLTPRQRAILEAISRAKSNKEIAVEMGLSCETVKSHMRDIFRRLNVKNRMQAAQMYRSVMQKLKEAK